MSTTVYKPFGATLFSRALYSSWCHVPKYEILFDCGEGCALNLGNDTANIRKIFLGHGHGDHVLGLVSFIGARNASQGISRNPETRNHNKALEIFYPVGDESIESIRDFCAKRNGDWLRYDLKWTPIRIGTKVEIGTNVFIEAFKMEHQDRNLSLGYVIRENRKRLKAIYQGQNIRELLSAGIEKDSLNEHYTASLFAYCLDAYEFGADSYDILYNCEYAVMDCTFLSKKDRTDTTHFTIDEALTFCHNSNIKNMIAAHVSPRYDGYPVVTSFLSENTSIYTIDSMKPNLI